MQPNFSAYPWDLLPKLSRRDAALHSAIARWLGACREGGKAERLAKLLGVPVEDIAAKIVRAPRSADIDLDPHAARCIVRRDGVEIDVFGSSTGVRAIAQRLLGGPAELPAPRPLTLVERAIWSLVVATALEDLGVRGDAWPDLDAAPDHGDGPHVRIGVELLLSEIGVVVVLVLPAALELRVPDAATGSAAGASVDRVVFDLPLVVGRCALHRDDLARLAVRQLVTLDRPTTSRERRVCRPGEVNADLEIGDVAIGATGQTGELGVRVTTEYVPRDMALPDDAHVELTVSAGSARLSLRQVSELAIGQILPLGRPLAGPFEVRAQGRVLGRGELVDVDGELAVRIVSLGD